MANNLSSETEVRFEFEKARKGDCMTDKQLREFLRRIKFFIPKGFVREANQVCLSKDVNNLLVEDESGCLGVFLAQRQCIVRDIEPNFAMDGSPTIENFGGWNFPLGSSPDVSINVVPATAHNGYSHEVNSQGELVLTIDNQTAIVNATVCVNPPPTTST